MPNYILKHSHSVVRNGQLWRNQYCPLSREWRSFTCFSQNKQRTYKDVKSTKFLSLQNIWRIFPTIWTPDVGRLTVGWLMNTLSHFLIALYMKSPLTSAWAAVTSSDCNTGMNHNGIYTQLMNWHYAYGRCACNSRQHHSSKVQNCRKLACCELPL